jgi:hypothetical protein
MRVWTLKTVALLGAVGLFLAGLILLSQAARDRLREQGRYTLPFADISCTPPPGLSRADFLEEVRYYAAVPGRLHLLEPDLAERLAGAFARHPWVAEVERVEVVLPAQVEVRLRYRRPALAVRVAGRLRVVDDRGVLLPRGAAAGGLPVFQGQAAPPAGPVGTPWGDPAVEAAARAAGRP